MYCARKSQLCSQFKSQIMLPKYKLKILNDISKAKNTSKIIPMKYFLSTIKVKVCTYSNPSIGSGYDLRPQASSDTCGLRH